jgi:hypothetical protein
LYLNKEEEDMKDKAMSEAASALGKKGGSATTIAKQEAVKKNGLLGGRPTDEKRMLQVKEWVEGQGSKVEFEIKKGNIVCKLDSGSGVEWPIKLALAAAKAYRGGKKEMEAVRRKWVEAEKEYKKAKKILIKKYEDLTGYVYDPKKCWRWDYIDLRAMEGEEREEAELVLELEELRDRWKDDNRDYEDMIGDYEFYLGRFFDQITGANGDDSDEVVREDMDLDEAIATVNQYDFTPR